MLNTFENLIAIFLTVGGALLFMWAINRIWPSQKRRAHNDLIGWQLSILGTTYAVILGFMLYTVWNNYGIATLNADNEANALGNIYRLAEGLPAPQRGQIEVLARSYADTVVASDWPQMANNQVPEESHKVNQDMWRTFMAIRSASPTEVISIDHALSELSALTEHRRMRLAQSVFRLPFVLWCVLIIGGVVTIASTAMFGAASISLHAVQVSCFSLLVALVLVAVSDIDRPFQGVIHVSNFAFLRVQRNMKD